MNTPYWYYNPNVKQAFDVRDALTALSPVKNQYGNYGIYGGAGALGGAGIGALLELLKDKKDRNYLKSMLIGGGIGGGLGLGAKGLGDYLLSDATNKLTEKEEAKKPHQAEIDAFKNYSRLRQIFDTNDMQSAKFEIDKLRRQQQDILNSSALDAILGKFNLAKVNPEAIKAQEAEASKPVSRQIVDNFLTGVLGL